MEGWLLPQFIELTPEVKIPIDEVEIRETLEQHPEWIVDIVLAGNPQLEDECQVELAKHEWWIVRAILALNKNLNRTILSQLAADRDFRIRAIIAIRLDAPEEVLKNLSKDGSRIVRLVVASRPLPKHIWEELLRDENEDVKRLVIERNLLDEENIKRVIREKSLTTIFAICAVQRITPEVFKEISSLKEDKNFTKQLSIELNEYNPKSKKVKKVEFETT
jgi:hypothetical protein